MRSYAHNFTRSADDLLVNPRAKLHIIQYMSYAVKIKNLKFLIKNALANAAAHFVESIEFELHSLHEIVIVQ